MLRYFSVKNFAITLALTLLIGSIWYLLTQYEWLNATTNLRNISIVNFVVMIFLVHVGFLVIRTWRWMVIVRVSNPGVRFGDLYWTSAILLSCSIITPGQLGEALKIELLKRQGILNRLPGISGFVLERLLDIIVIAGMGVVGFVLDERYSDHFDGYQGVAIILFVTGISITGLLIAFVFSRLKKGGSLNLRDALGAPVVWGKMTLLTVVGWGLIALAWQVVLGAADIRISVQEILWLISLVTIGSILSLIPGGVGVGDLIALKALIGIGVDQVAAQSGVLLLRIYAAIVVAIGIIHLVCWIFLSTFCWNRK